MILRKKIQSIKAEASQSETDPKDTHNIYLYYNDGKYLPSLQ